MTRGHSRSYYDQGSTEPALASSLTVRKLERRRELTCTNSRLVIVLVGLPGRGKSFLGRKLQAFLTWRGVECKVFNVGKYRRQAHQVVLERSRSNMSIDHDEVDSKELQREEVGACNAKFFDSTNVEAARLREEAAMIALKDLLRWLARDSSSDKDECQRQRVVEEDSFEFGAGNNSGKPATFRNGGKRVAIYDATNSTNKRRDAILETCALFHREHQQPAIGVVFVESICDDKELLDENFKYKIATSPDFKGLSQDEALQDLRTRAKKYEERYDPIKDDSLSYIKVFNFSSKILSNQIYGRMSKVIVPALMAWHIGNRPVLLCRAGKTFRDDEGTDGSEEAIGTYTSGDAMDASEHSLSSYMSNMSSLGGASGNHTSQGKYLGKRGSLFRDALSEFVYSEGVAFAKTIENATRRGSLLRGRGGSLGGSMTGTSISGKAPLIPGVGTFVEQGCRSPDIICSDGSQEDKKEDPVSVPSFPCFVMTSTMPRAIQTASKLPFDINEYSHLNPLDKGEFAGMDLDEIKREEPEWYDQLQKDPFGTRFPGGESYHDLVKRLESAVIDIEQQVSPVLVVSHASVIQCLLAYFRNSPVEDCTKIEVPTHTVFKLMPLRGGGWQETLHKIGTGMCSSGSESGSENDDGKDASKPIWGLNRY